MESVPVPWHVNCALEVSFFVEHGRSEAKPMDGRTILVVDDSDDFGAMVELALEPLASRQNLRVLRASSGEEALQLLEEHPDTAVMLTDRRMPTMDGLELIAHCRRQYPLLQVVALSAAGDGDSIIEAVRVGASDYIVKPPTLAELESALERALERHLELERAVHARQRLRDYERELAIAADIQRHMLPSSIACDPAGRYQLSALLVPARHVAGDFYDHWRTSDGRLVLAIGDVSGKGISAALWMAVTKTLLRSHLEHKLSLEHALEAVNRALASENPQAYFVTALVAILDPSTGALTLSNAAHIPPYLIGRTGTIEPLHTEQGMPLGALETSTYSSSTLHLSPGDQLVLVTDGILDALSADLAEQPQLFEELLARTFLADDDSDPTARLIALLSQQWVSTSFPDDVTLVTIEFSGVTTGTNTACSRSLSLHSE